MDKKVINGLKKKFKKVHPLVFHRSLEYAKTPGELFDILDSIPEYPIAWDDKKKRWQTVNITLKELAEELLLL